VIQEIGLSRNTTLCVTPMPDDEKERKVSTLLQKKGYKIQEEKQIRE